MSGAEDLDRQRERAAHNQALFRQINQRIDELTTRFSEPGEEVGYVCECIETDCIELLSIPHDTFEQIRRHPREFIVVPGHEDLTVEEVVDQTPRWLVVRKLGAGGELAERLSR